MQGSVQTCSLGSELTLAEECPYLHLRLRIVLGCEDARGLHSNLWEYRQEGQYLHPTDKRTEAQGVKICIRSPY